MTAGRRERQGAILRLIAERRISTQAELVQALHDAGYDVVQTTISRDIADLGLVKVRNGDGRLIYAVPGTTADADRMRELRAAMVRWALTVGSSANLCLITTPSGYADALAQVIDESRHPLILGTVAGENTIMLVAREGVTGAELADELEHHLLEGAA
jgi:transcriptional regulator of arginine metabolism